MSETEAEIEDFDLGEVPELASQEQSKPAFTDYTTDAEFRKQHPLALRALCGGIDVPRGVRPYGLVAIENPLKRPWVYEHSSGLPLDAFGREGAPCKYKPEHLRVRFRWEPGETKLVPTIIIGGLWQRRDGVIVGGGGIELRLAKGAMPPLSPEAQRVKDEQDRAERERTKRVRS